MGEGAFGAVYLARQHNVEREVAVKVIQPEFANQPDFIRRFETEAQLVAQLEHLHIVPLYDYWRDPDGAYLAMRYLKGGSLEALIGNGLLSLARTANTLEQITSALAAAHRKGIVHRDLKPANIMLDEDGNAYLSDFSIAEAYGDRTDLTFIGATVCIPVHISPHLVRALLISLYMDFYRRGMVLYTRLTDKQTFSMTSPGDLIARHLHDPLPNFQNYCSSTALRPGGSSLQDDKMCKERHSKAAEKMAAQIQICSQ